MTTETITDTTQATETTAPSSTRSYYIPTPDAFSAMTSAERSAALERSHAERAAYQASTAAASAGQDRPRGAASSGAHEFTTDPEIHGAQTRVGQAQATFEREQKALYRSDGTPRYSDAEHTERLAGLRADFDRVVGAVQQTVDGLIAGHTTALRHLAEGDPLDALTGEQLTKATQQMAYVKEDVQALAPAELVTRCQAALQMGDVPTLFNLARYVGQRLDAAAQATQAGMEQAMAARASALMGASAPSVASQGQAQSGQPDLTLAERQTLGELVAEMRTRVRGPRGQQKAEATRTKLQTALGVKAAARAAHDVVHDTAGRQEASMRNSGRYSL